MKILHGGDCDVSLALCPLKPPPVLTGGALTHRGPDIAVINSDRKNFGVAVGIGFRLGPIFKRNLLLHLRNMAAAKKHPTESIGARLGGALEKSHLPTRGGACLGGALEKSHFPTRGNGGGGGGRFVAKNIKLNKFKQPRAQRIIDNTVIAVVGTFFRSLARYSGQHRENIK